MKKPVPLSRAHRLLAPRPVALVTVHLRGRDNVMPAAWVCPVSLEPPLVIVAIHPARYTHDMLKRSEEFVLNIPGRGLLDQVIACGAVSGQDTDKFSIYGLNTQNGQHVEAPWITECLAHIECALVTLLEPGDHTIFIAQIVGAWAEEEAFDEVWRVDDVDEELLPLHHLGNGFFVLLGKKLHQEPAKSP